MVGQIARETLNIETQATELPIHAALPLRSNKLDRNGRSKVGTASGGGRTDNSRRGQRGEGAAADVKEPGNGVSAETF